MQIVSFDRDALVVNHDALAAVVDVYGVRNLPVAIVSVAGKRSDARRAVKCSRRWGTRWRNGTQTDTRGICGEAGIESLRQV